jgi:hypothetical protein
MSQCAAMQRRAMPFRIVPSRLMSLRSLYATTPCYIITGIGSTYGEALIQREAEH